MLVSFMKKTLLFLLSMLAMVSCYDDARLWEELQKHEERIAALETLCSQMNTNISSMQSVVNALQTNDFITAVTPVTEGDVVVGYTITFGKSAPITIYFGKDGEDGSDGATPVIGVRQDEVGVYYWTLNGEWMKDGDGNKIRVTGKDGKDGEDGESGADAVTPMLNIEDGWWYVSYNSGVDWQKLDKATGADGDSFFMNVSHDDKYVYFTLADGTVIAIAKKTDAAGGEEGDGDDDSSGDTQAIVKGPIALSLGEVTATTVTFNATLDVDMMADYQEVGLIYSQSADLDVENEEMNIVKINKESYTETFTNLSYGTEYYYTVYLLKNNIYCYGDIQMFATLPLPFDGIDLSAESSANCYIVSSSGNYSFEIVKGNKRESVGKVKSIVVLWESFGTNVIPNKGDLIKSASLLANSYGVFCTADTFREGNAVIAAKDADGKILWSWHIWLTDQPQGQIYNNNAGTMMDRNLGATSATPGDVGTLGLLYQWGRKDPFLGSSSISNSDLAESTITWPSEVSTSSSRGTVDYVTSNPTTFVKASSSPYDWHYSSRDNTLWTTSESAKSIYDPCPAGWRVPDGGSDGVWSKAGFDDTTYYSTNEGMSFSITSPSMTWYPASGYRGNGGGGLYDVGNDGSYWSASPYSNGGAYSLYFSNSGYVDPSTYYYRAHGGSVRCLQE